MKTTINKVNYDTENSKLVYTNNKNLTKFLSFKEVQLYQTNKTRRYFYLHDNKNIYQVYHRDIRKNLRKIKKNEYVVMMIKKYK
jgi:hypothetical protein